MKLRAEAVQDIVAVQWALTHWNQNFKTNNLKTSLLMLSVFLLFHYKSIQKNLFLIKKIMANFGEKAIRFVRTSEIRVIHLINAFRFLCWRYMFKAKGGNFANSQIFGFTWFL